MRKALPALGVSIVVGIAVLPAAPAAADYAVTIAFPDDASEFYSPFDGPTTVSFTFDESEADATFSLRIRPDGGTAVHAETVFVNADDPLGSEVERFTWPALSVTNPRVYEVAVYRNGGLVTSEGFLLRPPLVTIDGATPDPFFPWIDDGHKDTTHVAFTLAADADAEARVFEPTRAGRCCGPLVRTDSAELTNLFAGPNSWTWDGRGGGGQNLSAGDYFVKIRANDGVVPPVGSRPRRVAIARTFRAKATKSKPARSYHHVGAVTPLVLGGDCMVRVDDGLLRILCQGGRVTVYWRWGLASNERILGASFVLGDRMEDCPRSIRSRRHTTHESSFTMAEDLVGRLGQCWIVTARIRYSYLERS